MKALICVSFLCIMCISFADGKRGFRRYGYSTGKEHASLILKNDSTFTFSQGGCTFAYKTKGVWSQSNDTISLTRCKTKHIRGRYERYLESFSRYSIKNEDSIYNIGNKKAEFVFSRLLTLREKK